MWRRHRGTATRREAAEARHREKALAFRPCAECEYDIRTGEGERSCHWYACPYLPEELDVFCPTCNYDFFTREGAPECGATPRCEYAVNVAPQRVANVRDWTAMQPGSGDAVARGGPV
ncbi:MAG TPA: hypothetical protein VGA69_10590 [Nitriliruptorales bacterium]